MATRFGVGYISMIMLHSATAKTPVLSKNLGPIYYTAREMANLVLKFTNFRYHGNSGRCGVYFNDTVKLCDPENPLIGLRILAIFITQAEKWLILC